MRAKFFQQPALIYVWESAFSQYSAGIFKDCFNTHCAVCPLSHRKKLCSELHCVGCVIEFPAMHPAEKVGCKTALEAEMSPCRFLTCSLWFTAPLLGFNSRLCAQSLPLCPPLTTFTPTENMMEWWDSLRCYCQLRRQTLEEYTLSDLNVHWYGYWSPDACFIAAGGWRLKAEGWRPKDKGWSLKDKGWSMKDEGWRMKAQGQRMKDEAEGWRLKDKG